MLDFLESFLSKPLVSMAVGSVVTWLCSWYYYRRAGTELKREASALRTTTKMILRWLETEGMDIEIIRDKSGEPTELRRKVKAIDSIQIGHPTFLGGELRTVDKNDTAQ